MTSATGWPRVATRGVQRSTNWSGGHWNQPKYLHTWSPWAPRVWMGKGQMGQRWCLGSVVGSWLGMQHAQIPYAPSHLVLAAREAGAVANQAGQRKTERYANLRASHHFVLFAIETSGVFGSAARPCLKTLTDESKQRLESHGPSSSSSKEFR